MTAKLTGRAAVPGVSAQLLKAFVVVAGFSLAGCADVDSMLFGSSEETPAPVAGNASATTPAPVPAPGTETQPVAIGSVATITPVAIEAGSDTGTAVNKTVAGIRSQLATLQGSIVANAQRYADLRNSGGASAAAYHEARARITTRLQMGTTRGNPELVAEWNRAQAALDQLSGNINSLNAIGTQVAGDASSAHYMLDQINATFNVSGAVDEDHRQLTVLQDETNQTIVSIDRLLTVVSGDVQRQTAYVANERANLTTLASAIKNGELYGADLGSPMITASASMQRGAAGGGTPLVVIRFDRPNVDYQQILYAALQQALQTRPGAAFSIVGVSPTRGTASAVQLAQSAAHRHAQEVLRSMTDMGVPASRLAVASATDPAVNSSEVRVFLR